MQSKQTLLSPSQALLTAIPVVLGAGALPASVVYTDFGPDGVTGNTV